MSFCILPEIWNQQWRFKFTLDPKPHQKSPRYDPVSRWRLRSRARSRVRVRHLWNRGEDVETRDNIPDIVGRELKMISSERCWNSHFLQLPHLNAGSSIRGSLFRIHRVNINSEYCSEQNPSQPNPVHPMSCQLHMRQGLNLARARIYHVASMGIYDKG